MLYLSPVSRVPSHATAHHPYSPIASPCCDRGGIVYTRRSSLSPLSSGGAFDGGGGRGFAGGPRLGLLDSGDEWHPAGLLAGRASCPRTWQPRRRPSGHRPPCCRHSPSRPAPRLARPAVRVRVRFGARATQEQLPKVKLDFVRSLFLSNCLLRQCFVTFCQGCSYRAPCEVRHRGLAQENVVKGNSPPLRAQDLAAVTQSPTRGHTSSCACMQTPPNNHPRCRGHGSRSPLPWRRRRHVWRADSASVTES